jgi:hypothetical protein
VKDARLLAELRKRELKPRYPRFTVMDSMVGAKMETGQQGNQKILIEISGMVLV